MDIQIKMPCDLEECCSFHQNLASSCQHDIYNYTMGSMLVKNDAQLNTALNNAEMTILQHDMLNM